MRAARSSKCSGRFSAQTQDRSCLQTCASSSDHYRLSPQAPQGMLSPHLRDFPEAGLSPTSRPTTSARNSSALNSSFAQQLDLENRLAFDEGRDGLKKH